MPHRSGCPSHAPASSHRELLRAVAAYKLALCLK